MTLTCGNDVACSSGRPLVHRSDTHQVIIVGDGDAMLIKIDPPNKNICRPSPPESPSTEGVQQILGNF